MGDMSPRLTAENAFDGAFVHTKLFGDVPNDNAVPSHLKDHGDICLGQFGNVNLGALKSRTATCASLLNHVRNIVSIRPKKQMVWINAGAIVAFMQNMKPVWDGSFVNGPRQPVCPHVWGATASRPNYAIPTSAASAGPFPAFVGVANFKKLCESIFNRRRRSARTLDLRCDGMFAMNSHLRTSYVRVGESLDGVSSTVLGSLILSHVQMGGN